MKNKIQIFKHTTDDWHPNFENNLVSITLIPDDSYGNEFRISIWVLEWFHWFVHSTSILSEVIT